MGSSPTRCSGSRWQYVSRAPGRAVRRQSSKLDRRVQLPRGTLGERCWGFESLLSQCGSEAKTIRDRSPCGAARSARHPVKVEATGSNPVGGAGGGRKNEKSKRQKGKGKEETISRYGPVVYRLRTLLSRSGKAGSTPARAARNEPRRGGRPAGSHKAGFPDRHRGLGFAGGPVLSPVS